MRLLSLNVALFEQNNQALKTLISSTKADLLCLQEVTKKIADSANDSYISKDTIDSASHELSHSFFAPIWALEKFEKGNFHGKELFQFDLGGTVEFGQYLKSKFPIIKGQNVFVQNHFSYVTDWSSWPQEDYRAVQVTDLELPQSPIRILNYHGIWSKDKKGTQQTLQACNTINKLANEVDYPSIICGDFNLFPDTDSMSVFTNHKNLLNDYSIKTTRPRSNELSDQTRNVVDYILVSKNIKVNNFSVLDSMASDHLPLILDFEI